MISRLRRKRFHDLSDFTTSAWAISWLKWLYDFSDFMTRASPLRGCLGVKFQWTNQTIYFLYRRWFPGPSLRESDGWHAMGSLTWRVHGCYGPSTLLRPRMNEVKRALADRGLADSWHLTPTEKRRSRKARIDTKAVIAQLLLKVRLVAGHVTRTPLLGWRGLGMNEDEWTEKVEIRRAELLAAGWACVKLCSNTRRLKKKKKMWKNKKKEKENL